MFLNRDQYQIGTIYQPPSRKSGYWQTLEQCWECMPSIPTAIVGDFNADALNKKWCRLEKIESCISWRRTRELHKWTNQNILCPSSSTCLGLLPPNLDESPACEVIETHISDHQMIIGSVPITVVPHPCSPLQTTRDLQTEQFELKRSCHKEQPSSTSKFTNKRDIRISHINVRSLRHKLKGLEELISSHTLQILSVWETWLDNSISDNEVMINGFQLYRRDRQCLPGCTCKNGEPCQKQGGTAILWTMVSPVPLSLFQPLMIWSCACYGWKCLNIRKNLFNLAVFRDLHLVLMPIGRN